MTQREIHTKAPPTADTPNTPQGAAWIHDASVPSRLHLPRSLRGQLACLVEVSYPFEACGLLIGRRQGDRVEVVDLVHARHFDDERTLDRYGLNPGDLVLRGNCSRGGALEVVGVWRSHPDASAIPNGAELEAAWPGYSYLIIAVSALGTTVFRSWQRHGESFREERLVYSHGTGLPLP